MKDFIKPGAEVWVLGRSRVRSGKGPRKAVVAEINNGVFRTSGTRGWYSSREAYLTQVEATAAWHDQATAEYKTEQARYNKIANRLMGWQNQVASA